MHFNPQPVTGAVEEYLATTGLSDDPARGIIDNMDPDPGLCSLQCRLDRRTHDAVDLAIALGSVPIAAIHVIPEE